MEARDPRSRIRPLSPEAGGGGRPPAGPPPVNRWLVIGGATLIVAALLVLFGVMTTQDDGAAAPSTTALTTTTTSPPTTTTTTTTTTTLPPTLGALAPGLGGGLAVVAAEARTGSLQRWGPADRAPRPVPLTSRPDIASFDAGGTLLMYEIFTGEATSLHVGTPSGGQPAVFVGVRGALWHRTEPARLAWAAQLPTETSPVLYVADVNPRFGDVSDIARVTDLPAGSRLAAFGDWGYAVQWPLEFLLDTEGDTEFVFSGVALTVFDPTGVPTHTTVGRLVAHGGDGLLVVIPGDLGFDISPFVDPSLVGEVVVIEATIDIVDPTFASVGAGFRIAPEATHYLSPDGEWLVEVAARDGGLVDITANGVLTSLTTRSRGIQGPARPIGITPDGIYLLLQDLRSNELVMFNWEAGIIYRVPVPEGTVRAALPL